MLSHPGRALTIYDIAAVTGHAYYREFIPANITTRLSKTINREFFTDDFLLPSDTTVREEDPVGDVPDEGPSEEAIDKGTEPNGTPTPGHAGRPHTSTTAINRLSANNQLPAQIVNAPSAEAFKQWHDFDITVCSCVRA